MEISVEGAVFLGAVIPFGLLIMTIEARHGWSANRAVNGWQFLGVLLVVTCSLVALVFCFVAVNSGTALVGGWAWFVAVVGVALYIVIAAFLGAALRANSDGPFRNDE